MTAAAGQQLVDGADIEEVAALRQLEGSFEPLTWLADRQVEERPCD